MCRAFKDSKNTHLAALGVSGQIWTIPAIHGEIERLTALHNFILEHFTPGDCLVYLGNYTGYGQHSAACIDEILTFRRMLLSIPGMLSKDFVYLRGRQEEMWQKLLQLQFAPDPTGVLLWMLGNGLSATLQSYGLCPHDGIEACRYGTMGLTKWTATIRATIRDHAGHEIFAHQQLRAAYTSETSEFPMLFVHAGLDTTRPLNDQGDSFWWSSDEFSAINKPYLPYKKVIRGFDPHHGGLNMNCITATLDDGCGFGGKLICAGFEPNGQASVILEA